AGRDAGRRRRARAVAHRARHGGPNGAVGRRSRPPHRSGRRRAAAVSGGRRRPRLRRRSPLDRLQSRPRAGGATDAGLVRPAPVVKPTLAAVRFALQDFRAKPEAAPGASPAAVALILLEGPRGLETLLIRRAERGDERTFPAYVVDEIVIWGMTERILTPFLKLISV